MVVDFETQKPNNDISLENTTRYKARNLLRIQKGDINFLPNFGFNLNLFEGQTQVVLKGAISQYLLSYLVDVKDIHIQAEGSQGLYQIIQSISSIPYRKEDNNAL